MVGEHQGGNYSQNFTHYSILVFLMDVTIIPKIDTIIYSQCDHLNMENTTVFDLPKSFCNIHTMTVFALGVPRLVNILKLNMNGGFQANFLSTGSAKQLHFYQETPSFWSVRLFCTLDNPFILRKLTNYSKIILHSLSYLFLFQV